MENPAARRRLPIVTALIETFGFSPGLAVTTALFIVVAAVVAILWVIHSAPPRRLVLSSGPVGSSFQRFAESYQKRLATHGVTLDILPSGGSVDNLQRLQAADSRVDIGFVQGGFAKDTNVDGLLSLGSIAFQPLWVFYRSPTPITRLADLSGQRIAVGIGGSGTRELALTVLSANGITSPPTTFLELDTDAATTSLLEGKLDAVFLMGDSASTRTLRTLARTPGIQLFNFTQADAYVRRYAYLNKMQLPQGSIDLAKNLPAQDVALIGPTVELVARKELHSALSDLLIGVAQEVHGRPGLLQKRGEFPAPLDQEITISNDARLYYKSGQSFLYRNIPSFWLANLLNRLLVAIVPLILVLIPAVRFFPVVYRWSIQLRIYRCYRPLLRLERDSYGPLTHERVQDLLRRLDEIEENVSQVKVPASFAYQFYELRGHLAFVRQRLKAAEPT